MLLVVKVCLLRLVVYGLLCVLVGEFAVCCVSVFLVSVVVRSLLFVGCCLLLSVACCVCCLMFVVRWSLRVVCWWFVVGCY